MTALTRYFVYLPSTSTGQKSLLAFDLNFPSVDLLANESIVYKGTNAGVESVLVGGGIKSFDFTSSLGQNDQMYLTGSYASYTISASVTTLTLTSTGDGSVYTIGTGDTVIFSDGALDVSSVLSSGY